ncbi:unnamed protein product [Polarella glacialis]|uniref:Uncharacterized protein n=1 Tax=Polarella glacialis TaxID=89957 RepID=A0A813H3G5_POLGL|nr:unnamed protein product [Polarella glacialis]
MGSTGDATPLWETACRCGLLSGGAATNFTSANLVLSSWQNLASAAHCWDSARKIPPYLYAAANVIYQGLQEELQLGKELSSIAGGCAAGAFTALLLVLLLWEAHDAPEQLVDSALGLVLGLEQFFVAAAVESHGVAGVLDCPAVGRQLLGSAEGLWPGVLDLAALRRLKGRLTRKRRAWQTLEDTGEEPWHAREEAEQEIFGEDLEPLSLCLCLMHGEGALTLRSTLESYKDGGLLEHAQRRFIAFLDPRSEGEPAPEVSCWRERLAERFGFQPLLPTSKGWPDPFIRKRQRLGTPGAAMAACARACDQEHVLFLEDDFELVTRPASLVRHRLRAAMRALAPDSGTSSCQDRSDAINNDDQTQGASSSSNTSNCHPNSNSNSKHNTNSDVNGKFGCPSAPTIGVHLRHKLFFGAPFYELLTAAQHSEPPSPYTAWYFSPDPVRSNFPDGLWARPFWDSLGACDSNRLSWHSTLQYQQRPASESETRRMSGREVAFDNEDSISRVWWCSEKSSLLCTSTAAHRDPFRSSMYSTNPMLYRTETWQLHLASYAAVLQDLRAVEESVSSSFMWRVEPSFVMALSLGLFRHRRLDRRIMPEAEEDPDAAFCLRHFSESNSNSNES